MLFSIVHIIEATSNVYVSWHKKIDQEVENLLKNYPIPGVVILVGTKQDILFQKPYGYVDFECKKK